jgi:hypothetical protein
MAYNHVDALITALGGATRVAEEFGLTTQAISNWIAENNIPKARQIDMLQLVIRVEALEGRVVRWRPEGWDPNIELRYNTRKAA